MDKRKIKLLVIGLVILVLVGNILLGLFLQQNSNQKASAHITPTSMVQQNSVTYAGVAGRDALTLLKEKYPVEVNNSGMVVSINGRKADDSKKEFWAFRVNGELAQVGPADYVTLNIDKIEWKIETY